MGKYRHNTNGSTELVLVKQNFLLRGIRDSRTLIVQVLIGAMHGLVVSILVIRNFALTEFAIARLHCNLPYLQHQFSFVIIVTCVPLLDNSVTVSKKKYETSNKKTIY